MSINPYVDNEKAAEYVDYYASKEMLQDSVNRLYHGGMERRRAAELKAERDAYPPRPTVRRTQAEIDRYLQERVEKELLRRQQHRAALQRELTQTSPSQQQQQHRDPAAATAVSPRSLNDEELARHVKRMYDDQVRRKKLREAEIEKVFGRDRTNEGDPSISASKAAHHRQLEARWRPPSASVKHDDNTRFLVSQYEYYANPRRPNEVTVVSRRVTAKDRSNHEKYLTQLARPQRITPKIVEEERDANAPHPFRVTRKVDRDI